MITRILRKIFLKDLQEFQYSIKEVKSDISKIFEELHRMRDADMQRSIEQGPMIRVNKIPEKFIEKVVERINSLQLGSKE